MISFASPASASLFAAQTGRFDTATDLERWAALASDLGTIVIAVALVAIVVALVPVALSALRAQRRVRSMLQKVQQQAQPLMGHAVSVADNVDYVTTAIRSDVERLKQTIDQAQARLERAASVAEERIARFNSLLDLVQDEAEALFVDAASTVRGVRAGTEVLREPSPDLAWEWDEDPDDLPADRPERPRRNL